MQGLAEVPVRNHLFRLELNNLEDAISAAEQEDFSMRHDHASSSSYRPARRQESGGPEPMDLCYVESERPRSSNNKRLQKCNRCQKLGHYAYECSAPHPVPNNTGKKVVHLPKGAMGVVPALLRNRNNEEDHPKTVGVSRGGAPY